MSTYDPPPPIALSMIVCESIWHEYDSEKLTLVGCFRAIQATSFPTRHPFIRVCVDLTNGRGEGEIRLVLTHINTPDEPIVDDAAEVDFVDVNEIRTVCFDLGEVTFPEPGEYEITLFVFGQYVIARRILLQQVGEP
jgi:hypothetical protein